LTVLAGSGDQYNETGDVYSTSTTAFTDDHRRLPIAIGVPLSTVGFNL
jgi:hypothetical protein